MAYTSSVLSFESGGSTYIKGNILLYQDPDSPSTNRPYAKLGSVYIYAPTQAALTNKTVIASVSIAGQYFSLSEMTWIGPTRDASTNTYYLLARSTAIAQVNLNLNPGDSFYTTIQILLGSTSLKCSGTLYFTTYVKLTPPSSVKLNSLNYFNCTPFTIRGSSVSGIGYLRPSINSSPLYLDETTVLDRHATGMTVSGFYWYPSLSIAGGKDFSDNRGTYVISLSNIYSITWSSTAGGIGGVSLQNIVTDTASFTGTILYNETPPAAAAPTVTLTATEISGAGLLAQYGRYIKGMSQVRYTAAVSFKYGAKEAWFDMTVGYDYVTAKTYSFWPEESGTATAHVQDDHDNETEATATYRVYDYWTPELTQAIHRCRSDGTRDDAGSYCLIEWAVNIAPLGSQNSRGLIIQHPAGTTQPTLNSYTASGELIVAADPERSYDITFVLSDDFGSVTRTVRLSTAGVIMDIFRGGHGLAFGKVAETDHALEISSELDTILNTSAAKKINLINALEALAQATGVDIYVHE